MAQNIRRNRGCIEPTYWGNDPYDRIEDDRTPEKIRKSLEDELRANGNVAWLWLPVAATADGVILCTCDKQTSPSADYKCLSCYGTRYVPGYRKFLHETMHFSSAEYATFTLSNLERDTSIKPHRLKLTSGSTTGSLTTGDKAYANPGSDTWTVELAAYKQALTDTVALDFSTDAGASWTAVTLEAGRLFGYRGTLTPTPTGTGTLRFRVTLTRASGSALTSPSFEILRTRHVRSRDVNEILRQHPKYQDGMILTLKTWDQEFVSREIARGRPIEHLADRMRTAPLDFFDTSIPINTPAAALDDREAGPHPMIEYVSGVRLATRYAVFAINLDHTIHDFLTYQSFSERRSQEEMYTLLDGGLPL